MEEKASGPPNGTNLNEVGANQRYLHNPISCPRSSKAIQNAPSSARRKRALYLRRYASKSAPARTFLEASNMRFVARNTSIPVPKVYYAFTYKGATYFAMERIKGDTLAKGWVKSGGPRSKATLPAQLRGIVEELCRVPSPRDGVSIVDSGSIHDVRLPDIHGL